MSAQFAYAPQSRVDMACTLARRLGEVYVVYHDTLLREFKVSSARAYIGCGKDKDRRYELCVIAKPCTMEGGEQ